MALMFNDGSPRYSQDLGGQLEFKGSVEFRFAAIVGLISHSEEFGRFLIFLFF